MYVTPRMLLGIIRISQALAKLNFRDEVTMNDVDESLKLMDYSFRSLKTLTGKDSEKREARKDVKMQDQQAEVMRRVKDIWEANQQSPISINELFKRLSQKHRLNIQKEELEQIINYYQNLSVLYVNPDKEVMFV